MSFFDGIEQTPHPTSAGPCDLPILYRDGSMASLLYRCAPDDTRDLLAAHGLEPMVIAGKVLVVLAVFEYRDSTVGIYNELGIGVHAKQPGSSPRLGKVLRSQMRDEIDQGLCVVSLPVTTPEACAAGIELWGYPKYVTGIELEFDRTRTRCVLRDELSIETERSVGLSTPALPLVTFSDRGRVRTLVEIGSKTRWSVRPRTRVQVLGEGQSADIAKTLRLDATQPVAAFRTERFQAILPAGVRRHERLEARGRMSQTRTSMDR